MAVDPGKVEINPYTSTVPLVSIPPEQMQAATTPAPPLPGQFGKKSTVALSVGDALLKGFMQGHALKEQKKYEQAQATIQAADKNVADSYSQYQDALTRGDKTAADAAYANYQKQFNDAKEAKAKFVIPEKPAKGSGKKKGVKDEVKSMGGGIKEFFQANPHLVPQIALLTMQPKPPGPSAETQQAANALEQQKNELATQQNTLAQQKRTQEAQKVYDLHAGLSAEELAALPPDDLKAFNNAKAILFPPKTTGAEKEYVSPDGNHRDWFIPGYQPTGWDATAPAGSQIKPGSKEAFFVDSARAAGLDPYNIPPPYQKYLEDLYVYRNPQTSSTTSGSTVDASGNRTTTNTATRGAKEPQPPPGFKAVGAEGLQPPPQAGGAQKNNFVTQSFQGKDVPGMLSPGNDDITYGLDTNNADGTHSSVFSMSSEIDGKEVMYRGVGDGKTYPARQLTKAEALDQYRKTGKSLGTFKDAASANAYTKVLHEDQAKYGFRPSGGMAPPPTARGGLTPPPTGKMTLTDANRMKDWNARTQKAEAAKAKGFSDAEAKYQATVNRINSSQNYTQEQADQAKKDAAALRDSEQKAAAASYDQESKAIAQEQDMLAVKGGGASSLPDAAKKQLKAGYVTTFGNGQQWTLDENGQPKQVK